MRLYTANPVPINAQDLPQFIAGELHRIESAMMELSAVEFYDPTLTTGAATELVKGNGTLLGVGARMGNIALAQVDWVWGSTSVVESPATEWHFSLPWTCESRSGMRHFGSCWVLDTGTQYYIGTAQVVHGNTYAAIQTHAAAVSARAAVPITWATGDRLCFSVLYPVRG